MVDYADDKWIVDCDMGIDDMAALFLIRSHQMLHSITLVHGNLTMEQQIINARMVLNTDTKKKTNTNISDNDDCIHVGALRPLVSSDHLSSWPGHGHDGCANRRKEIFYLLRQKQQQNEEGGNGGSCGDVDFDVLEAHPPPRTSHAAIHLVETSKKKKINILALGPLTNLAIALSLDPEFCTRVNKLVCMGGTLHAKGNSSMVAEFNFLADPEAAHVVLQRMSPFCHVTIIPWETTLEYAVERSLLHEAGEKNSVLGHLLSLSVEMAPNLTESLAVCDAVAAAVAIDETIVKKKIEIGARVAVQGECRGMLMLDWAQEKKSTTTAPVVSIVEHLDRDKWNTMLRDCFVDKK